MYPAGHKPRRKPNERGKGVRKVKKKEPEAYSKKKYTTVLTVSIVVFAISFLMLLVAAILQENGVDSRIYTPLGIACFPLMVLDIIYMLRHHSGMSLYQMEKQMKSTIEAGCEVFENINTDIKAYCEANKFERLNEGYYHRRKFNFAKDYVNYFVQKTYALDVGETIEQQYERFDACEFKKSNVCLLLFIEKDHVDQKDLEVLTGITSLYLGVEAMMTTMGQTALTVLIDREKGCAYCVPPGKNKLSFYNIGYKQVKKMLHVDSK